MSGEILKKIYLAISYSGMEESSYQQSTEATALLTLEGTLNVFSPITHSHPLVAYGARGDWQFWSKVDYQFLDWCNELWVLVPKEGIEKVTKSIGVSAEVEYIQKLGKPIKFVEKVGNKIQEYGRNRD